MTLSLFALALVALLGPPADGAISPAAPPDAGASAAVAPATAAQALPAGEYGCYTYNPKALYVGGLVIRGDSYESKTGAGGRYRLLDGGRVDFLSAPPLGFAVAILEQTEPTPKLRLYRQAADIGKQWRAAVCTLKTSGATTPAASGANGGAASTVGGKTAESGEGGSGFAARQHVEANFIGVWYKATVVRCDASRCLLHYDDPSSKEEWVDQSRLRSR